MKSFKEWLLESESKVQKICYMVCLEGESAKKIKELQKSFDIKAGELVPDNKFHVTIRFMKTDKDPQPFIDYLDGLTLPMLSAKGQSFERLNDAFVLKLESKELHDWFDKINEWVVEHGYPKSDYDTFLPHISFSYETDPEWKTPEFDKEKHGVEVAFTKHELTSKPKDVPDTEDYKVVWEKKAS